MLIVGERINTSRKSVSIAVTDKNIEFIKNEVQIQSQAGADYIDINAGTFADKESEKLSWLIEIVQETTSLPICIDSADPKAIKQVLPIIKQKPMINSITLEKKRLDILLPVILEHQCKVIGLCQADGKSAHTDSEKVEMADQLILALVEVGHPLDDIYIDPLVFSVATDTLSACHTLNAIRKIMKNHQGVHTICGLTNVSYGLPVRKLVNRTFLISAILMGLDAAIIDPTDNQLFASLKASLLINGKDSYAMTYLKSFREGRFSNS
jgi:5-methyltetrahydrofolate--homocysteine methyltransferase